MRPIVSIIKHIIFNFRRGFLITVTILAYNTTTAQLNVIDLGTGSGETVTKSINIPNISAGQVTKLFINDLKNGGTISINGNIVDSLNYCMYPGIIDISRFITPGLLNTITITCNHRPPGMPVGYTGSGQGVIRGMELRIYNEVNISDCFIRPSVKNDNFYVDVWVQNSSSKVQTLKVKLALSAWNINASWPYAPIQDQSVNVAPNSTEKKTFGPFVWGLGSSSYWWPNIPYSANYEACLHNINIQLIKRGKTIDTQSQRFGFVEISERFSGGALFFSVNGIPVFQNFDAPTESLMQPSAALQFADSWNSTDNGAKATMRRYQSFGFNGFRVHMAPVSETMLNAADEIGFMLVPETGINQNSDLKVDSVLWGANIRAMIRFARSHPSVVRYSLWNETKTNNRKLLINFCSTEDKTRPYSFSEDIQFSSRGGKEVSSDGLTHAWSLAHYWDPPSDSSVIVGIEENNWFEHRSLGMAGAARNSILHRYWGYAVSSPWTWLNYWPDFIPGLSYTSSYSPLRGLDFESSDLARYAKNCMYIFACADINLVMCHQKTVPGVFIFEKSAYDDTSVFDEGPLQYSGTSAIREIVAFNNSLTTVNNKVIMEARWDSPSGTLIYSDTSNLVSVGPSAFAKHLFSFLWPDPGKAGRTLYLGYRSIVNGQEKFYEDRYCVRVTNVSAPSSLTRLEAENCLDIWNCVKDTFGVTGFPTIRSGWQKNSISLMQERGQLDLATWPKCDLYRGWIRYTLDFGTGAKKINVQLTRKTGSMPISLELRTDEPHGKIVSTIPVPVSVSPQVCSGDILGLRGVHDVYLIIPYLFDNEVRLVDWISFSNR